MATSDYRPPSKQKPSRTEYMRLFWKNHPNYRKEWRKKNREKDAGYVKKYRTTHLAQCLEREKKYRVSHATEILETARLWRRKHRELRVQYADNHKRNHPDRIKARQLLAHYVHSGKIKRSDSCSRCGAACKPEAHHPDYSKPLEVIWLCLTCHSRIHAMTKETCNERE